jgi:hypothetical protein
MGKKYETGCIFPAITKRLDKNLGPGPGGVDLGVV